MIPKATCEIYMFDKEETLMGNLTGMVIELPFSQNSHQ